MLEKYLAQGFFFLFVSLSAQEAQTIRGGAEFRVGTVLLQQCLFLSGVIVPILTTE